MRNTLLDQLTPNGFGDVGGEALLFAFDQNLTYHILDARFIIHSVSIRLNPRSLGLMT